MDTRNEIKLMGWFMLAAGAILLIFSNTDIVTGINLFLSIALLTYGAVHVFRRSEET